ncbi:uncharacterized protein ACRADG_003747 isoform 2-T4 [Cochliomyia hominivorax]
MLINLKVKTLDSQTHEFSIDNEITVREFKDKVAEKTNIAADQQRIIYCGRVMVDDKQLKEYDVDGKVVHVAERPPPSQRLPANDSSSSNANPSSERRNRARPVNMRNSALFRALDGMVVGTMAFPMNANTNGQAPVNPFTASSSFCMNRITVARHMLECANNIAAYLEDPSRGLNNQSLDILARGRWTMESTVVEVGITSDIPQSQQIVEMVQGAVQAALRRSGNTNVTLVQLPTVYSSNENDANNAATTANIAVAEALETDAEATAPAPADVFQDVIDDDENTPTNESNDNNSSTTANTGASTAGDNNESASTGGGNNEDGNDNSRRRTGTPVLAGVIEQMRNVQNRLNPFIEQYYDLLQNEPTFEENDTTGRENAQRLFDRVSEAFHYMSHAQHAISDLMLDVSQGTPRYLTCRPILVEQSGYVSSNNFLTPAMIPAAALRQQQQPRNSTNTNATATSTPTTAASIAAATTASTNTGNTTTPTRNDSISGSSTSSTNANNATVDDPIDDPVVWNPTINFGTAPSSGDNTNTNSSNNNGAGGRVPAQGGGGTLEIILQPSRAMYLERNFQRQVARLLQDVVSAAPFDTEFHVHINTPNVVSIDVPIGISGSSGGGGIGLGIGTQATNSTSNNNNDSSTTIATSTTTTTSSSSNDNNTNTNATTNSSSSSSSTANPARVTTATLPTTSTQTRSTSRPQVHFGNIPVLGMPAGWNGRVLPNNNVSSFDRFLPCNSHHIREPETANNTSNDNGTTNNVNPSTTGNRNNPTMANIVTRRPLRTMNDIYQRMRPPRIVGSTMTSAPRSTNNLSTTSGSVRPPILPPFMVMRDLFGGLGGAAAAAAASGNTSSASSSTPAASSDGSNQDAQRLNIHTQLMNCLNNHIFEGQPINDDTIPPAINRAIEWFGESLLYLPQYEKPEYDSRDSLFNILRSTLPMVIELLKKNPVNLKEFEQKLKQICEQFRKRLYSVLYICTGRTNADLFWAQLMRLLCNSVQSNLQGDVVEFLALYLTPTIPNSTDEADAQQFIVLRNTQASNASNVQMPMDTDVEMSEAATTSQPEVDDEPLPAVVPGSATWHRHFPNDWLPIITRDIQRQTDNPPEQPPFSDAYISGMSSKRRKLVQNSKPPTEIGALIADSVRKAIQNPELGTSTSANQTHTPEDVARAIASDAAVQSSCIDAVRTNVRERLKKDPDFEAEKFPKSNKFIKK